MPFDKQDHLFQVTYNGSVQFVTAPNYMMAEHVWNQGARASQGFMKPVIPERIVRLGYAKDMLFIMARDGSDTVLQATDYPESPSG